MTKDRREFFIDEVTDNYFTHENIGDSFRYQDGYRDQVKVTEIKKGEAVYNKDDVEMLLEALRFYSDETNWYEIRINTNGIVKNTGIINTDLYEVDNSEWYSGGKRARQALKNWERGE